MFALGLTCFVAYLLGSVSGSLVVGRVLGGGDIRREGSGNAGATNALRTRGVRFALPVVVIDIAKGFVAAAWLPGLGLTLAAPSLPREHVAACCGAAAVLGHIWPFWHGFRGGKGAATLIGAYLALLPALVPWFILLWLGGVVATGYVGLWTMLAAISVPVFLIGSGSASNSLLGFALGMALLVVFAHRDNIARLRAGTENRMTKAMFWRRGSNG